MPDRRFLSRFFKSRGARVGALLLLLYLGASAFAGLAPRGPQKIDQTLRLKPPGAGHWLGTDELGRDVLSRVLHGARLSLLIGVASVALAALIGIPLGLAAGELGGWVDQGLMRGIDILLAFPGLLLALALLAVLGPSLTNLMVAIAIVNVPAYARQVRASVLQVRNLDYVAAARALGASRLRVVLHEILPNILGPIVVLATLGTGTAILEAAGLGFIGLGMEPDTAEWGSMLARSRHLLMTHSWTVIAPGVAISAAILGFNLLGDAMRDYLDVKGSRAR